MFHKKKPDKPEFSCTLKRCIERYLEQICVRSAYIAIH